jgi:hypothetical protein
VDPRLGGGVDGEVVAVVPVPEPAGPVLAAVGAVALALRRGAARRRAAH